MTNKTLRHERETARRVRVAERARARNNKNTERVFANRAIAHTIKNNGR